MFPLSFISTAVKCKSNKKVVVGSESYPNRPTHTHIHISCENFLRPGCIATVAFCNYCWWHEAQNIELWST